MPTDRLNVATRRWVLGLALYVVACLAFDFRPHYGPPHFRYTGSDPSRHVWNLGWPSVTCIYDSRFGFQVGPSGYVLFHLQALGLASGVTVIALNRWLRRSISQPPASAGLVLVAIRALYVLALIVFGLALLLCGGFYTIWALVRYGSN